jgi:tetratricopeptide (TPR) repeat protein
VNARASAADAAGRTADELLPLAMSRPSEALAAARAMLAGSPDAYDASVAHQAAAIVLREFGDVDSAVSELGDALRFARRTRLPERICDVLATRGVALVYAGRTTAGLASFDRALRVATGALTGRVLARRGMMLWALGRYQDALADLRHAVVVLRRANDHLWAARALNARAVVHLALGSTGRAEADFTAAERLYTRTSQQLESVYTIHNRAYGAFQSGDLPAALTLLDQAATGYRQLKVFVPALSTDRCAVLLAAGLATDALAEAHGAVRDLEEAGGQVTARAELMLTAASCALAAGQPQDALELARAARRRFAAQQRAWWQAQAACTAVQAKYAAGQHSARLLAEAEHAASRLEPLGSREATRAHLIAGRVAADLGRIELADQHLSAAARGRLRGPAIARTAGWLGEALRADAAGDERRLFAACRNGLAALAEHQLTLGASELRAQAMTHGSELAALALRHAARARGPRRLLAWSERCRATTLAVPAVRPVRDAELNARLTALRDVARRLDPLRRGTSSGGAAGDQERLERELARLERAVRDRALLAPGASRATGTIDIRALLDRLGSARLVEIVEVDGQLLVLVCGAGRVRRFTAGRAADAAHEAAFARFALRRLARSREGDELSSALAILHAAGHKLRAALLGPAASHLGDGPVIIVPPGRLHTIPWTLIPELFDRSVSVCPSATAWLRAASAPAPPDRRVTLAAGPGMATGGAEIAQLARQYPDATVLADGAASVAKVLEALDGCWLAHVAAHGTFRGDSPMFSALRMQDGPLTVYDFEQLRQAPYRIILPSCDSGVLAPAGTDELLGLASSLLPLGTSGIVAAIVPLSDRAVVPVMVALHRRLGTGESLAAALRGARTELAADPLLRATAMSLLALGAG